MPNTIEDITVTGKSNRLKVLVVAALLLSLTGAVSLGLSLQEWAERPAILIAALDDPNFIDARIGTNRGSPFPDEFELPKRFNGRVCDFFGHERRSWRRPNFPDQLPVAQLRFRSDARGSLLIDIYDVGGDAIGVGTSGHRYLFDTPGRSTADLLVALEQARTWAGIPEISEVTLSRSRCHGSCPVDTVTIQSNGTARYEGEQYVEFMGNYDGNLAQKEFRKLAKLIDDNGFAGMDSRYSRQVTDVPTLTTTVRWGQKSKKIENHGGSGPAALEEIENSIVTLIKTMKWMSAP